MIVSFSIPPELHALSWSGRVVWLGLICSTVAALWAAGLRRVERRWRMLYLWLAADCLVVDIYFGLLVFGLLSPSGFVSLLKWSIPVLAFSVGAAPLMHIMEDRASHSRRR